MMPHAHLRETQRVQEGLRVLYLLKCFECDRTAILNARRKTCRRRLVPHSQSSRMGKRANLPFAQTSIGQRRDSPVLIRSPLPWTEVAGIVTVASVGQCHATQLGSERLHHAKQFVLAMKA